MTFGISFVTFKANASCRARFSFSVSGYTATIYDSSSAEHYYKKLWSFGDGIHSDTRKIPFDHVYTSDGSYRACLIIEDTVNGCRDTFCETIKIEHAGCTAAYSFGITDKTVKFEASTSSNSTNAKYRWKFGDGDTAWGERTSHTFADYSTYEVCLTVIDSPCEQHVCKNVAITHSKYHISGIIDADHKAAYPGRVWLIVFKANDSILKAVKDGHILRDTSGNTYYDFSDVEPGTYYVKAALDTTSSLYSSFLPTYYENAVKWKDAIKITVSNADVTGKNIHMKKGTNPGGKGFVGGRISHGANKAEGDPMSDILVMVFDQNGNPVAYNFSDINGNYSIGNLANGKYEVYAEVPGIPTYPAWIEISDVKPGVNNVDIKVNSLSVVTSGINESKGETQFLKVYPSPVSTTLHVNLSATETQNGTFEIFDVSGKKLISQNVKINTGTQDLTIDTRNLSNGMFILKVSLLKDGTCQQVRFVKTR